MTYYFADSIASVQGEKDFGSSNKRALTTAPWQQQSLAQTFAILVANRGRLRITVKSRSPTPRFVVLQPWLSQPAIDTPVQCLCCRRPLVQSSRVVVCWLYWLRLLPAQARKLSPFPARTASMLQRARRKAHGAAKKQKAISFAFRNVCTTAQRRKRDQQRPEHNVASSAKTSVP